MPVRRSEIPSDQSGQHQLNSRLELVRLRRLLRQLRIGEREHYVRKARTVTPERRAPSHQKGKHPHVREASTLTSERQAPSSQKASSHMSERRAATCHRGEQPHFREASSHMSERQAPKRQKAKHPPEGEQPHVRKASSHM
eukprot:2235382-Pleurochrysis_carterae.AAC.1